MQNTAIAISKIKDGAAELANVSAYGVMMSAIRHGVAVPQQLSIAGFDDLEWSRHLQPSLTTIHMPTNEIWRRAGSFLVDLLAGQRPLPHHCVDFALIVRESTVYRGTVLRQRFAPVMPPV